MKIVALGRRSVLSLIVLLASSGVSASDHIDGPVTTAHRVADITDLFAFPTPGRPGFLTIILDAYPLVPRDGHFTDKVNYSILLRRASIAQSGQHRLITTGDEVTINCTFQTPDETAEHVVTCRGTNGLAARVRYDVMPPPGRGREPRLYAGMRADPFFFNADFATDALKGRINAPDDENVMTGVNVLCIALEVHVDTLFGQPSPMIAVAAETTTRDSPRAPLRRLDRVGRPEITNVTLGVRDAHLKDQFNSERPFQVPAARQHRYEVAIARSVAHYDALDGRRDWNDANRASVAALLAEDFLVVDLSKPCRADSFLEIEKALLQHAAPATCGGRRPADDIMDTLFTLYVAGLNGKLVRDGVDHPATPLLASFPYLTAPDLGFWSAVRVFLARKLLRVPDLH